MIQSVFIRALSGFILLSLAGVLGLQFIIRYEADGQIQARLMQEQVAYRSVVNGLSEVAQTLFDETINTSEITALVYEIGVTEGDAQDFARGMLLRKLYPSYLRLKERGVRQLHFHHANGLSLLRFHRPLKYGDPLFDIRPSVYRVNTEQKAVKGFETGRLFHGFRFVFPLFHDGQHIGSVESSVSFDTVEQQLKTLVPNELFGFVLNKEQVFSLLYPSERSIYKDYALNDNFLVEDVGAKFGSPREVPSLQKSIESVMQEDKVHIRKMMNAGSAFGLSHKLEGQRYAALFTPVNNLDGKTGAYIISFTRADELEGIYRTGLIIQLIYLAFIASLAAGYYRHKTANIAVAKERETLKAITERMAEGLFVQDKDGYVTFINEAAERILGIRSEEALGQRAHDLFHVHYDSGGKPVDIDHCPIRLVTATGTIYESEDEFFRRFSDNTLVPVQVTSAQFQTQDEVSGSITIFRDITQRKKHDHELECARQDALKSAQAKSEFLANMSHEIRTPMNGILGMLDLLAQTRVDDEQRNFLSIAQNSSKTLLSLLNSILDLAKYEAGKVDLEQIDFDLRESLEDTAKLFAPQAQSKGLEISAMISDQLPASVQGDPTRLRQVLANLLGNAIKFTEQGEITLRADLEALDDDGTIKLHVTVKDTGIGVSAAAQDKFFDSFSQADGSTTRNYGGTGLGLTLSREIIASMGGEIWLQSEQGEGSCFHFTIPLKPSSVALERFTANEDLRGLRALIVDDNATNRLILEQYCASWGIFHLSADEGQGALDILLQHADKGRPFDIVLTDMMMPGMDGVQMARAIRRHPVLRDTRMILLTSYTGRALSQQAEDVEFVSLIPKPFSRNELHRALEKALLKPESPSLVKAVQPDKKQPLDLSDKHILLVDDNEVNRIVAVANLDQFNCQLTIATNGQEALELLKKENNFDLVFMDCQMPVMDGLAATQLFRAHEKKGELDRLPIIAMTAYVTRPEIDRCLEAGMDAHLPKPFEPGQLGALLRRYFEPLTVSSGDGTAQEQQKAQGISGQPGPLLPEIDFSDFPVINSETLAALNELFDGDISPISDHLFERIPKLISELLQAVRSEQWQELAMAVHALKGIVGNFGADRLVAYAGCMEQHLEAGQYDMAKSLAIPLAQESERMVSALKEILAK
ncbi:response regulator [Oceanospirillum linum]|uniref:Sensory/regulatory protein RpfC n=1 Tax=Oceanospirillum linum TaxID=966 RepID=A0A1T1HCK7_OCELI|nr:response regulator [Oceanospirillum linum]OOV87604.1 hypothetical protein BTA35_0206090 [Oceanospirillum linum]SEF93232.1 PAS domain S-box-containing protein [Oleiphilus messinensis]SMP12318.1 PAS domain S-box-containing protein [Oceanospirillum linum]